MNESHPAPTPTNPPPYLAGGMASRKKKQEASGRGVAYCEYWANEDPVKLPEGRFVTGGKRDRELLALVRLTVLQGGAGKREATKEPHQTLCGSSLLLAFFVLDQLLEGAGESGGSVISSADFLCCVRWEGYE